MYNPSSANPRRDVSRDAAVREWFVEVAVEKFALDKSFLVEAFLGDPQTDPTTWRTSSNFISLVVVFRPSGKVPTEEIMTYGEIPLKKALEGAGLANASPATVAAYLTEKLQWRIQKVRVLKDTNCRSHFISSGHTTGSETTLPKLPHQPLTEPCCNCSHS
jgi:Tyosinase C-terminal domain